MIKETSSLSTFLLKSSINRSFGTAFCVHNDKYGSYLVTVAHVVEACGKDTLWVEGKEAELCFSSSSKSLDLAVIYVKGLESKVLTLTKAKAKKSIEFKVYGFKEHLHGNHTLEQLEGRVKKSTLLYVQSEKIERYELSIKIEDSIKKGYSGSAICCATTGDVFAVATNRKGNTEAEALPIAYLESIWEEMPPELIRDKACVNKPVKKKSLLYKFKKNIFLNFLIVIFMGVLTNYISNFIETNSFYKVTPSEEKKIKKIIRNVTLVNEENVYQKFKEKLENEGIDIALKYLEGLVLKKGDSIKNNTNSSRILLLRGGIYEILGQWEEAEKNYKSSLEYGKEFKNLFAYALFLLHKQDYTEALNQLTQILEKESILSKIEKVRVWTNMAIAYTKEGNNKASKQYFEKAWNMSQRLGGKHDIEKFIILKHLGDAYLKEKNVELGEKKYKLALGLVHNLKSQYKAMLELSLGNLYKQTNRLEKAEKFLKDALSHYQNLYEVIGVEYQDELANVFFQLGNLLYLQKKYPKAKIKYEKALKKYTLEKYQKLNLYSGEILEIYRVLNEISPSLENKLALANSLTNRGSYYLNSNKRNKWNLALSLFEKSEKIYSDYHKSNIFTLSSLAYVYYKTEKYVKATEVYEALLTAMLKNNHFKDFHENFLNYYESVIVSQSTINKVFEEKFIEKFEDNKKMFAIYEMLQLFDTKLPNKEITMGIWKKKYKNIPFSFSLDILDKWIHIEIKDKVMKEEFLSLLEALNSLKINKNLK